MNYEILKRNKIFSVQRSAFSVQKGFTFIDVMVGTALVLIVFLGIFGAYQLGLKVVGQSKNKITATAIANEQMEKIRNLPYQSVGTKGASLPFAAGILDSVTTKIVNKIEFKIETQVKFVIDGADGTGGADTCNWDYKRAEVKVSWPKRFGGEVKLITDISPKDKIQEIETCQAQPGGILSVLVFDAYGVMVPSPLIEVFNPETGQRIDFATPAAGKHDFPLVTSSYKIVVSKTGYSTERTYGTDEIANPEKPHPIVLLAQITPLSFSIDRVSSFLIESRGSKEIDYPVIPNVSFNLRGEKIIGLDANENPVYKYSQNHLTNDQGKLTITNLEWDSYHFSVLTPNLDLVGIESPPETPTNQPIFLPPNISLTLRLILEAKNSLLVTIQNSETLEPIFAAMVRLYNLGLGYDVTQYTNEKGQTYFIPLEMANYNLEVSAPGYSTVSDIVSVSGDETKIIKLTQIE